MAEADEPGGMDAAVAGATAMLMMRNLMVRLVTNGGRPFTPDDAREVISGLLKQIRGLEPSRDLEPAIDFLMREQLWWTTSYGPKN